MSATTSEPALPSLTWLWLYLAGQAIAFRVILSLYLEGAGTWPDVGSNFLAYWLLAVVRGTALWVLTLSFAHRRWVGPNPARHPAFVAGALATDVLLTWFSMALYSARFHG